MVVAFVDHRALLADLRKVEAVEVEVTADGGVWNMHVSELSSAQLVHPPPVVFLPGAVAQREFTWQRHHRDLPRVFAVRVRTNLNLDLLPCRIFKEAVNLRWRPNFAPFHSQQIFAGLHFHARLRERAPEFRAAVPPTSTRRTP